MNLEWHNSFIISIYRMLIYEVNIINRSLEDLTAFTCFRTPPKAIQIPLKKHFFKHF